VRWLQALGAQPLESGERAPQPHPSTGPLSPAQQSLRDMFAELDARRTQPTAGPASGALDLHNFAANGHLDVGAAPGVTGREVPTDLPTVTTIEDLEKQFAASGFAPVELRPGTLQAAAAEPAAPARAPTMPPAPEPTREPELLPDNVAPASEQPSGSPLWGESLPVTDAASDPAQPSAAVEAESEPASDDYMSQLRRARRRRAEGRNEEALLEYRAVLRDSPDMLDDLIHDLRDMSATTENPEVHRMLADAYIREGNYTDAIESYNRAQALTQSQQG
jgi:tetratricopeptide repeat protein